MHSSEIKQTVILCPEARLAQPAERKTLNLVVVGSSPTVGGMGMCHACLALAHDLARKDLASAADLLYP